MIKLKLSEFHYEDSSNHYTENDGYTWVAVKDSLCVASGAVWKPAIVKQLNQLDTELCQKFNVSKVELFYTRFGFVSSDCWRSLAEKRLILARDKHSVRRDTNQDYQALILGKDKSLVSKLNQIIDYAVMEEFMTLPSAIIYAESIVVLGREDDILTAV